MLAELKRRNVFKVGAAYLVVAWLVVQVASIALPAFEAPHWVLRVFILLLGLGFPLALVLAWTLELTPDGLRVEPAPRGNKRIFATAGGLAALALLWYFVGQPALRPAATVAPGAAAPTVPSAAIAPVAASAAAIAPSPKSIAVLPFADFSQGHDQSWFADGLTDEILNALTRTPDLLVSARTSSFGYKESTLSIPQIAAELGVAHVLEGSVRSTPQRIRVTAQLIRAADGFHVWSQNYDRDAADVIAIQEDLARQIAVAMQTSMDPAAISDMALVGTRSVEAYQAYLHGVATVNTLDHAQYLAAYDRFEHARASDPTFAAAHARAAAFWFAQLDLTGVNSGLTDLSAAAIRQRFDQRIDLAIRHAPGETDRLGYRARKAHLDLRLREAAALYQTYLASRPGDLDAFLGLLEVSVWTSDLPLLARTLETIWPQTMQRAELANAHVSFAHRLDDKHLAATQAHALLHRWPDQPALLYQIHRALLWDRQVAPAAQVLEHWLTVSGETAVWTAIPRSRQACAEGRRAEVEAALVALPADALPERWHLMMLLGLTADAIALLQPLERDGRTYALAAMLSYPQFDPRPFPSLMRVLEREKVQRSLPVTLPFACPPAETTT
jgi:TolB-like protein